MFSCLVLFIGLTNASLNISSQWKLFNNMFFPTDETSSTRKPTTILITYKNEQKQKSAHIHWPKETVDNPQYKTPFEMLLNTATKLIKNHNIPVESCDFIYYHQNDTKLQMIILNDNDLLQLIAQYGDQDANTRLVDIKCDQNEKVTANPKSSTLFRKATQAYNYIMGIGNDQKEQQLIDAKSELNQMGIGGFNIDANGIALLDIALEKYNDVTEQLAYNWDWSNRIRSLLDAVPHSGKVFSGSHNVHLDASTWKLKGTYARFAAFRSNENTFSIYVANAKFEFKIPKEQREGTFLDELGVSSSGAVKGEYMDKIITLLEHKALERFQIDVVKPEQDDYLTAELHTEL
eukprot:439966_1